MRKLKLTQIMIIIVRPSIQKRTMQALGLRRMNHSVEVVVTPQIEGMVEKVKHLLLVEEI